MERCRVPRQNVLWLFASKYRRANDLVLQKTPLDRTSFNGSINGALLW